MHRAVRRIAHPESLADAGLKSHNIEQVLDVAKHIFSNYFTNNTSPPFINAILETEADRPAAE